MVGIAENQEMARETSPIIEDSFLEMVVGESFIDHPWDKAATEKAREPLGNNGHPHLDFISKIAFSELAWFFDPLRHERVPDYGPDAVAKMRQPVLSYSHYRVGPTALRLLSDLAWS
jgi:hypothetical protein